MNQALRYSFNLPWRAIVLGVVFYGALSVGMVHLAKDFAGVIYVSLITLSAMFAVLAFIMLTRRLVFPRVIEFDEVAIRFPHGFPRTRITRIPYSDIIRMSDRGDDGLYMVTARGSFEVTASCFPTIEIYRAVKNFICANASIVMTCHDKREPSDWRIWGFPKPILRWMEPADWARYRTHLIVSKPLLPRLAKALWFFARCTGIILLPWLLLHLFQLPTLSAASFLWVSIPAALFFTSLHWLNAIYPVHASEISFRDNGITQFFGKQTADWNYHDFFGWTVVEKQFEGRVLPILLLKGRTRVVAFALQEASVRDRLVQLFHDKQIPQTPDLKPSWESSH